MKSSGVHHVSLNVDDLEAAIGFYVDALGCTVRSDRPDLGFAGAWLDIGEAQIHLLTGAVPAPAGQHFAIQVHDLEASREELRVKGYEVSAASAIGTGHQAFLSDPAGNLIELHQAG